MVERIMSTNSIFHLLFRLLCVFLVYVICYWLYVWMNHDNS